MICVPSIVALLVFSNTLRNGFVHDDAEKIAFLKHSFPSPWQMLLGRSLTHATYFVDHSLWDWWAPGFHLTNVSMYALTTSLVAFVALRLSRSRNAALVCGLLFAVHPVHVEVVTSITNRKDILALLFILLSLCLWNWRRFPRLGYAAALLCFACALLSKEVAAIGLPMMLLLSDLMLGEAGTRPGKQRIRRAMVRAVPFVAIGAFAIAFLAGDIAKRLSPQAILEISDGQLRTYGEVLANAASSVPENVRLLAYPVSLSADYPARFGASLLDASSIAGIVLVVLWVGAAVGFASRFPLAAFAIAWPLVMVAPFWNVIPIIHFFVADRYLFAPSFGVCLLLGLVTAEAISWIKRSRYAALRFVIIAGVALLIGAGAARSFLRNRDWADDRSLWESSLRAGIESARIQAYLGTAMVRRADYAGAIGHYRRALQISPGAVWVRRSLAATLHAAGRLGEAALECQGVVGEHPDDVECLYVLAQISRDRGDIDIATAYYNRVLSRRPGHVGALINSSEMLVETDSDDVTMRRRVISMARMAASLTEHSDAEQYARAEKVLAIAMMKDGEPRLALMECQRVLDVRPQEEFCKDMLSRR